MRNIYKKIQLKESITQGTIISGCVADEYPSCDVFGLIITPRCDLAHGIKVPSVHYLPVIRIQDWKEVDGLNIFEKNSKSNIKSQLDNWINKNYGKKGFLDSPICTKEKLQSMLDERNADAKIKKCAECYANFDKSNLEKYKAENTKGYNKILERLSKNDLASFYLLEGWSEECDYYVVNLREIHKISRQATLNLNQGFFAEDQPDEFFMNNSFRRANKDESIICGVVAQLNSPFIEHLLQRYVYNFARIGVDDLEVDDFLLNHKI